MLAYPPVPGFVLISNFVRFGWGALPLDHPVLGWGGKAPTERSFLAFDRGGQTGPPRSNNVLFGAADNTGAADDMGAADDCPTATSLNENLAPVGDPQIL